MARLAVAHATALARVSEGWRRERDSNPRWSFPHSGFQDHRHRPLGHLSAFDFQFSHVSGRAIPASYHFPTTVVVAVDVLFAVSGSGVDAVTLAVFVNVPAFRD